MPIIMPGVKIPESNQVVVPTSTSILDDVGEEIGFISDISEDVTRRIERIREISASRAGRVREMVPGPEDLSLSGTGFALYESNVLLGLSKNVVSPKEIFRALSHQWTPFSVEITDIHPASGLGIVVTYSGCMIERYGRASRIGDLLITETFSIQAQSVNTEPLNG